MTVVPNLRLKVREGNCVHQVNVALVHLLLIHFLCESHIGSPYLPHMIIVQSMGIH